MGKQKRAGARFWLLYTLVYSLLFCLLCRVVFAPFFAGGHSFVWRSDGLSQVYVRLGYLNENFRRSVRTLLSGGGWTFPLYDFRQGLFAEDVQLGFPYLPALFWPEDSLGSLYTLLVFSGFYLAGLSFSVLGF